MWIGQGGVCIVTGANSGIGKEVAKQLAKRHLHVILACRSQEKATQAVHEIISATGNQKVEFMELDLASFASVRRFVREFQGRNLPLQLLINNAGLYLTKRQITEDGYETTFQVNHLSHFLLTTLLMENLKSQPSRVITVSSVAHAVGHINLDNLNYDQGIYFGFFAYGHSKLANILFARELQHQLNGSPVLSICVHPGGVITDFYRFMPYLVTKLFNIILKSPEEGARSVIYAALASGPQQWRGGEYVADCAVSRTSKEAKDGVLAKKLWEVSQKMVEKK